jgi:hypothetical protein
MKKHKKKNKKLHTKVKVFSSGHEYRSWLFSNCSKCNKNVKIINDNYISLCDIEEALALASVSDGLIPQHIFDRMGDPADFDCPELDLIESELTNG